MAELFDLPVRLRPYLKPEAARQTFPHARQEETLGVAHSQAARHWGTPVAQAAHTSREDKLPGDMAWSLAGGCGRSAHTQRLDFQNMVDSLAELHTADQ